MCDFVAFLHSFSCKLAAVKALFCKRLRGKMAGLVYKQSLICKTSILPTRLARIKAIHNPWSPAFGSVYPMGTPYFPGRSSSFPGTLAEAVPRLAVETPQLYVG